MMMTCLGDDHNTLPSAIQAISSEVKAIYSLLLPPLFSFQYGEASGRLSTHKGY